MPCAAPATPTTTPRFVKTLKLRVKDKRASALLAMAREVNQVWNFCNETSARAIRERGKFLSGFDLQKLTKGYSKCDGVRVVWDAWHCDHNKAWTLGGRTTVENGQVACPACNLAKGAD